MVSVLIKTASDCHLTRLERTNIHLSTTNGVRCSMYFYLASERNTRKQTNRVCETSLEYHHSSIIRININITRSIRRIATINITIYSYSGSIIVRARVTLEYHRSTAKRININISVGGGAIYEYVCTIARSCGQQQTRVTAGDYFSLTKATAYYHI